MSTPLSRCATVDLRVFLIAFDIKKSPLIRVILESRMVGYSTLSTLPRKPSYRLESFSQWACDLVKEQRTLLDFWLMIS